MRILTTGMALIACCMAQEDKAVVRFSNGDQLSGNVLSLSDEKLTWESRILKEPAEFALDQVVDLSMPATTSRIGNEAAGHEANLAMTNGDSIRGQLAGLTNDEIKLKTWFGGELVFRRVNVKSVKISQKTDYFYRGPNSFKEWTKTQEESGWEFKSGALHCETAGGIGREIEFPDECKISFEASWRGAFRPKIVFFSNDISTDTPKGGYEMVFQGNSVHVKKAGSNNWLGHSTSAGELRENEKARLEIRASLKSGKILLYVDDKLIDVWQDDNVVKDDLGKGFQIVCQDSAPLKISNIEVTGWDGYTEGEQDRQAKLRREFRGGWEFGEEERETKDSEDKIPDGRMVLRNGDSIEGEVLGIKDEMISMKTTFSEVSFPVARLKNIVLKPADMETPKRNKGDVRATLLDGSHLVFRLDGVEEDQLLGFSQNFGNASFRKDAFKRIEFNIYDRSMEELRQLEDW
ncbi:MAG: hypothetical protein H7Y36_05810 [Armatimonadetes bacterium]|nr:hypothetical protein [Akkermansiaceae bacterium]